MPTITRGPRRPADYAWVALALMALVAAGCGRDRSATEDVSALTIARYRYLIDQERDSVWVLAEIVNTSDRPVKEAAVTAIVRGPLGESRGESTVVVTNIPPRRTKTFSTCIISHGKEREVEFRITPVRNLKTND